MAALVIDAIAESSAAVNLTTLAFDDWAHWGDSGGSITPSTRKSGGGSTIGASLLVTSTIDAFSDSARGMSWTDGTPTASSSGNQNGVWFGGTGTVGHGCRITFPAGTDTREATIYLGAYAERLSIAASLSDASASPASNTTTISDDPQSGVAGYVTFEYSAASAGQTLTVDVTCAEGFNGFGNTTLSGAGWKSLAPAGSTVTPADGTATSSTITGAALKAAATTAAAGSATASSLVARSNAAATCTAAAGIATSSTVAGSASAAASITAASGVATTGTLVGSAGEPDASSITPAAGSATTSTLSGAVLASASIVPAGGVASTETLASNGEPPAVAIGKGFEMGGASQRIREVSVKPLLQRVLEARSAKRIRPKADRAAERAKRIEVQAADMLLSDDATRAEFEGLMAAWRVQRPRVPEDKSPAEAFMSQVAFRIEQLGEIERAQAMADAQRKARNDEEALFLLLMA
jgi:hypothetical protein